jgi:hypothetical protein
MRSVRAPARRCDPSGVTTLAFPAASNVGVRRRLALAFGAAGAPTSPGAPSPLLPDGWPLVGRRVVGFTDFAALPLPREAYLPEGASLD